MELCIVSAFYDVGRASIRGFERDNAKYLEYFKFWAGLQNKLIIYTSKELEDSIMQVRKDKGLEHKTIIITKPLEEFDYEALKAIETTFKEYDQSLGRANPQNIEVLSARYNYVMYCKPFFVCDAIERGLVQDEAIWLDFGFNHGGKFFTNSAQFDFTLHAQENLKKGQMNFFSVKDEERAHLASIYYSMEVFLMGGLFYGDKESWFHFKEHITKGLRAFLSLNIVDDDQPLLLWCVRNYPQNYNIVRCFEWFDSLYEFMSPSLIQSIEIKQKKRYKIYKNQFKDSLKAKKIEFKPLLGYLFCKLLNK